MTIAARVSRPEDSERVVNASGDLAVGRRLLLGGASAMIGVAAILGSGFGPLLQDRSAALAASLRALFGDPTAALVVGALYLRDHPGEAAPHRLRDLLFGGEDPPPALAGWLARRRAAELAGEDVVLVGGWLLTRSEARLCALTSLVSGGA